jgi:NodT family efflux transporter outer membrane factor (OMF) lipoprotein
VTNKMLSRADQGARGLRKISCGIFLSVFMLCACSREPQEPQLSFPLAPHYREIRSVQASPPLNPFWWKSYHNHELSSLIETAHINNLDIAAALARLEQAQAQVTISGAALLPAINGSISADRSRNRIGAGAAATRNSFAAGLSGTWLLDLFGKNQALLASAQQSAYAAQIDKDFVTLTISTSIASSYFQLLALQDRIVIAQGNANTASRLLRAIHERESAGTASDLEVVQQEGLLASERATIPGLKIQLTQTRNALAVLAGVTPEAFSVYGGSIARIPIPRVKAGLPSQLLTRRPDIMEAEARLAAQDANIAAARAAFFPSIELSGQAGYQSAALATLFRPESAVYTIAANVTQTIFDGGNLIGQLELQQGRYDELLQTYRLTVLNAFADVENALASSREASQQVHLEEQAVSAAQRAFHIIDERLSSGTVDVLTLLNAQQTLFQSEDSLAQGRLTRAQASVDLFRSLGGGWPGIISSEVEPPKPGNILESIR